MFFFLFLAVKKRKKSLCIVHWLRVEIVIWITDVQDIPLSTSSLDIFANSILVYAEDVTKMKINSFLFKAPALALHLQNKEMTPASTKSFTVRIIFMWIAVHMH